MPELLDPSSLSLGLVAIVAAASMLQAITGIGFGVLAGPFLLVATGSAAAIQVSIALSMLIALLLAPTTLPKVNWRLLKPLFLGVCIGSPLGAVGFLMMSVADLKVFAAIVVGCMTLIATGVLSRYPVFERDSIARRRGVGVVCGILNTSLAMPGPPVAAYATAVRSEKDVVRATTLVTFLLAYPVAFAFQAAFIGISPDFLPMAGPLVLPTVVGTIGGMIAARFVAPGVFRWAMVGLLLLSTAALLVG